MPQMSPIWWMFLMMVFLSAVMMSMLLIYFMPTSKYLMSKNINNFSMNWKW
nr:ATP synthase F0 subunit 8 [Gunungidia aurantiifasciata]